MAQRDTYSTLVRWAKVILPLIAAGLFSSIFLFSKPDAIRDGLIFTDEEMEDLATGQKITEPKFAGVTQAGDAFTVAAKTALPDAPQASRIDLENPNASINTKRGLDITAQASDGRIDIAEKEVTLNGGVELDTSSGYNAQTDQLRLDLETGNAYSNGKVQASGPIGSIVAGSFSAIQNLDIAPQGGQAVLEFKNGVKLIYKPKGLEE